VVVDIAPGDLDITVRRPMRCAFMGKIVEGIRSFFDDLEILLKLAYDADEKR
jgi:hypothetical protein